MDTPPKHLGFRSIRNRILIFSILVTLVPSFGMGWFWLDMTRKATTDKIEQELVDSAGIAEREINLWFKERNYDLRVFANSFVVLDNLGRYKTESGKAKTKQEGQASVHLGKISTYLTLIRNEFTDYRRLLILDNEGKIIAASETPDKERSVVMPGNWQDQIARSRFFAGDVYTINEDPSPLILVGIPLLLEQNATRLGFFVMEVRLQGLRQLLMASLPEAGNQGGTNIIILLKKDGRYIISSASPVNHKEKATASAQMLQLFAKQHKLHEFVDDRSEKAVGLATSFTELPWNLVIAKSYNDVFAGVIQARNQIGLITIFLTMLIGATATIVASQIIIPLKALTDGVLRVAGGDLTVSVNIRRNDELGIVTRMFNEMVSRLKGDQAKLEQLATTDSLTGLANRKQIMADLAINFEHYRRYSTNFSILMIDIDNFKMVNDQYGHLVGDAVLVQLAMIFRETLRALDSAGRYGGEEFLIVLGKTDIAKALQTAERIRQAVEAHVFTCEDATLRVTVSVGVAGSTEGDSKGISLIGRADKALYTAKAAGRNCIALDSDSSSVFSSQAGLG